VKSTGWLENATPGRQHRQRFGTQHASHAQVCQAVPGALITTSNQGEANATPPVWKVAWSPAGLDAETNAAIVVLFGHKKPLSAGFEVSGQGLIAVAENTHPALRCLMQGGD